MVNFVQPVKADENVNATLGTSAALTDPNMLNLVYDDNLDLEQSYQEKGLMNLDVSRMLSETDEDYCSRFEQVAKEQTSFAVAIPNECLNYFESSDNVFPVTYFYGEEAVPYFVSTAFLVTGSVIALGGLLASTFLFNNSNDFVNSVYGTFQKLGDNAKTNLSNLFSNNTAYNDVSVDLFSEIHASFNLHNGSFSNVLGFKYNNYYAYDSSHYLFSETSVVPHFSSQWKCTISGLDSGIGFSSSYNGLNIDNIILNNTGDFNYTYLNKSNYPTQNLAENACSVMNFGYVYVPYSSSFGSSTANFRVVMRTDSGYSSLYDSFGVMNSSSKSFNVLSYNSVNGLAYLHDSVFWKHTPTLNVDEVDFYKNGSVTIGRFPDSLLDYTMTDTQTGAITGVLRPPLTNTQTGDKVETIVPTTPPPTPPVVPPVVPDEDFDGWGFNIDFSPLYEVGEKFLNVFPFSLVRDFMNVFDLFVSDPVTPAFDIPFYNGSSIYIDLSFANYWASFFRTIFNFVYSGLLAYYLFKKIST